MFDHTVNHIGYEILNGVKELFEVDEWQFAFNVRKLGQVSAGSRRLGAVRLSNTEYVTQRWTRCFQVQLRRLGQVGFLAEVVQLEQRRTALDLGLYQRWRETLFN